MRLLTWKSRPESGLDCRICATFARSDSIEMVRRNPLVVDRVSSAIDRGVGLRVWGLGIGVWGLGFGVGGLWLRVWGLEMRRQGSGFEGWGCELIIQCFGLRVKGLG